MGIYLCTVEEKNWNLLVHKFGPLKLVYRFQPATVLGNCCGGTRQKQNIVVKIEAPRSQVERSSLVRRVRTKEPKDGWKSLDGPFIHAQRCLGMR